jgi:hypothetical protein
MTVVANPKDADGAALQTKITALTAQVNALGNHPAKFAAQAALDQLQRELVNHFLMVGRITAATILSTLS